MDSRKLCTKRSTPEQRQKAIELYQAGYSISDCAKILGFAHSSVWEWLHNADDVKIRPQNRIYSDEFIEEVSRLYAKYPARYVAELVGLKHSQVMNIISNYGLKKSDFEGFSA